MPKNNVVLKMWSLKGNRLKRPKTKVQKSSGQKEKEEEEKVGTRIHLGLKP